MDNEKLQIVAVSRPPVSLCPMCSRLYSFESYLMHPCIRPARTRRAKITEHNGRQTWTK